VELGSLLCTQFDEILLVHATLLAILFSQDTTLLSNLSIEV